jgi:hypothetical protein
MCTEKRYLTRAMLIMENLTKLSGQRLFGEKGSEGRGIILRYTSRKLSAWTK